MLNKILNNLSPKRDEKYASAFRRGTASAIDNAIVLILRVIAMELMGRYWLLEKIVKFRQDFTTKFGTEIPKATPEHADFVLHSEAFFCAIIFVIIVILIGAFYHIYLNSSLWQATIGKRIMKIIITQEDGSDVGFWRATAHYFLSIAPFIFIIYLASYSVRHNVPFFYAVTASEMHVFLSILLVGWLQIHLFTKKKTTAYDLICDTVLVNGKTKNKFPWSKK